MSNSNNNSYVNDQNSEKIVLTARINHEKFKVSLKMSSELEIPLKKAAEAKGLTVQQYCEQAIREKLAKDSIR